MPDVAKAKAFLEGLQADLEAAAAYQVNKGGQQVGPPVLGAIAPGVRRHIEYWVRHALMALTSSPWRPIEECGELEVGYYLVTLPGNHFVVAMHDGIDWWRHGRVRPTHVHQMGPIRGPEETT